MAKFLLYGATGYTAKLILRMTSQFDLKPIIAGRDKSKIEQLATTFDFAYRVFSLESIGTIVQNISDVSVVLHCAGPFIHTAQPMMQACMKAGVHYLDITGEIAVFERAARSDAAAKAAKIMLMPGVGFDVVPTDCMAAFLKQRLPQATQLELAFGAIGGGLSHGTAMTMVEGMGEGGAIRKDGKIIKQPLGHKAKIVPFAEKPLFCMTIPWGDVSTSYYSTGIPNIEVYTATNPKSYKWVKLQNMFSWLMKSEMVKNIFRKKIKAQPAGPSDSRRAKSKMQVWGKVTDAQGKSIEATWIGPEGYTFTAFSALTIVKKVLEGHFEIGFHTPSQLYFDDMALEFKL
jgi:short subunit dehydrogenase-like uncharacterized protein